MLLNLSRVVASTGALKEIFLETELELTRHQPSLDLGVPYPGFRCHLEEPLAATLSWRMGQLARRNGKSRGIWYFTEVSQGHLKAVLKMTIPMSPPSPEMS